LAPDPLLTLPKPNHTYLTSQGKLKNPERYAWGRVPGRLHPKLEALIKSGNYKPIHDTYYRNMSHDVVVPTAGIARDQSEALSPTVRESDDDDNNDDDHDHDKIGLFPSIAAFVNYVRTNDSLQEEQFHAKPAVKLIIPDHIKAILVDDWENVTKNLQLVPLPAAKPVNLILNDYLEYEKPRRQPGSAQADILDEVVAGLKEYFEKCLGRILLYR
jgi:hypothetical protein